MDPGCYISYRYLHIHVQMHITCILYLQLKVYTAKQEALKLETTTDFVGFTLPSTSVTATEIPIASDVIMVHLYSSIVWVLYAISIITFLIWYHHKPHSDHKKRQKERIHTWIRQNKSLAAGMVTTAITTITIEGTARVANSSVWSLSTDSSSGVFLAIWGSQGYILFLGVWLTVFCHIAECCIRYRDKGTSKIILSSIHIILPLYLTAFGLFYVFFPAIILILAYPTQMIAIVTFALAYLFATTIFSAIMINLYSARKQNDANQQNQQNRLNQSNQPNKQESQNQQKRLIIFAMLF